jgi:hypothetical protein
MTAPIDISPEHVAEVRQFIGNMAGPLLTECDLLLGELRAALTAEAERATELEQGLRLAASWLEGWNSAEPYLSQINAILAKGDAK